MKRNGHLLHRLQSKFKTSFPILVKRKITSCNKFSPNIIKYNIIIINMRQSASTVIMFAVVT